MEVLPYALNASPGDQDLTLDPSISFGKIPIAAVFAQSTVIGATFTDGVARMSIGFFDGTNSIVISTVSESGVGDSNTATRGTTDECLMLLGDGAGIPFLEAAGVALIPNGVRINIGATDGSAALGACYLFFDDDGSAVVGTFVSNVTQDASVSVMPGIATDALLTLSPQPADNFFDDVAHSDARQSLGFALPNNDQNAAIWVDSDGQPATTVANRISPLGAAGFTSSGAGVEYSNFTTTQFDAITRRAGGGGTYGYLALSMPNAQFWTGVIDTPIEVSNEPYTAPGFRAHSLLQVGTIVEAVDSEATDRTAECFRIGGATKDQIQSVGIASRDGADPTDAESRYVETIGAIGAEGFEPTLADVYTPLALGFRLDFLAVPATAKKWPTLAIGRKSVSSPPPEDILDTFNQTDAASFSVARRLRAGYSGAAIEVRETGGGTLADISFDANGDLDEAALLAHCGANDGFVRRLYDNGTGEDDLIQTIDANQPQIVSAGSVIVDANGVPDMDFLTDRFLQTTGNPTIATQAYTVFAVFKIDDLTPLANDHYLIDGDGSGDRLNMYEENDVLNIHAGTNLAGAAADTDRHLWDALIDGASSTSFLDGTADASGDTGANGLVGLTVGARFNGARFLTGRVQEIIICKADLGGNRDDFRNNINDYYSVYA